MNYLYTDKEGGGYSPTEDAQTVGESQFLNKLKEIEDEMDEIVRDVTSHEKKVRISSQMGNSDDDVQNSRGYFEQNNDQNDVNCLKKLSESPILENFVTETTQEECTLISQEQDHKVNKKSIQEADDIKTSVNPMIREEPDEGVLKEKNIDDPSFSLSFFTNEAGTLSNSLIYEGENMKSPNLYSEYVGEKEQCKSPSETSVTLDTFEGEACYSKGENLLEFSTICKESYSINEKGGISSQREITYTETEETSPCEVPSERDGVDCDSREEFDTLWQGMSKQEMNLNEKQNIKAMIEDIEGVMQKYRLLIGTNCCDKLDINHQVNMRCGGDCDISSLQKQISGQKREIQNLEEENKVLKKMIAQQKLGTKERDHLRSMMRHLCEENRKMKEKLEEANKKLMESKPFGCFKKNSNQRLDANHLPQASRIKKVTHK